MPGREYEPIGGDTLRSACKVDQLVDEGEISAVQASEASSQEIHYLVLEPHG